MGMKDKQTPSRCWERCSSPRRMRVLLPVTPALPASTPGAWGAMGPGQSGERCPLLLVPHRWGSHRHPGAVAPHQPCALVSGPRQPPGGKTVTSAGGGSLVPRRGVGTRPPSTCRPCQRLAAGTGSHGLQELH